METRRVLMRSLAVVVVIASVIWTTTAAAGGAERADTCCTIVSSSVVNDPIISIRLQRRDLPCVNAVIFETEKGEFCYDPSQRWVQRKVVQFIKAQRNNQTSTPPPASSTSDQTRGRINTSN